MFSEPSSVYLDACSRLAEQTDRLRAVAMMLTGTGEVLLNDWRKIAPIGATTELSPGFPSPQTAMELNLDEWPDAPTLLTLLSDAHRIRAEVVVAWHALPREWRSMLPRPPVVIPRPAVVDLSVWAWVVSTVASPPSPCREPRMATWFRPTLSADEQATVLADRDHHPDPVVRRKMLVLWAVHLGHSRQQAADLADVGLATAKRYVIAFRDGGLDGLRRCDRHVPTSQLADHAEAITRSLTDQPVRTTAEAADRIQELTGLRRGLTQTRTFLAGLGFRWQRSRAVPVPPKSR